jgi:ABC-type Fe3+-citrate transport system substrate-binding protein
MFFKTTKVVLLSIFVSMLLFMSGCSSIQLVSKYDETIDKQAQQLQKKLDSYFVSIQSASDENLKYKNQQKFYEEVLSDLNAMEVRAGGIYKNQLTIDQLKLAKINLAYLVLLHKQCVSKELSEQQKNNIEKNGIDLSMDCNVYNGATNDITDRGDISLNRFIVAPVQSLFNQHFGAIMALELAKKRGETK